MIPVAAPPRLLHRLASTEGALPLLHRGRHAIYLRVGDGCVAVVGRSAAQVPCALRVASPDLGPLADVRAARLDDGVLHLDDVQLRVARVVDVRVPRLVRGPVGSRARSAAEARAVEAVRRQLPRRALDLLAAGDPAAVPDLLGRGDGLTPVGDDVLCGWLAARWSLREPVAAVAAAVRVRRRRTTALSAELLDCAAHGEALPQFSAWLVDASSPGPRTSDAASALLAVGHTSGAGLLLGGRLALDPASAVEGLTA